MDAEQQNAFKIMVNKTTKKSIRILQLEESATFKAKVEQKLMKERIEFTIDTVKTRKELTVELEKEHYDLVFMTDIIPDSTGIEALGIARKMKSTTPIVVFSDLLDEEVIANNFLNGASDYMLRNNLDRLGNVVRRLVGDRKEEKSTLDYQQFFEDSLDLFAICDSEAFFLELNESWSHVLGFSPQELKAKPFIKYIHQDDLKEAVGRYKEIFDPSSRVRGFSARFVSNSGQVRWLNWSAKLQADGKAYVIARDETEQKLNETNLVQDRQNLKKLVELYKQDLAKKKLVADQIRDSVIITDLKGIITSWNKGSEKVFGFTPQETVGKHIAVIYPEKDYKYIQQAAANILLEQIPRQFELQMKRKSGAIFDAELTLDVTRDKAGKVNGMIGYAIDLGPARVSSGKSADMAVNSNYSEYLFNDSPIITYALDPNDNNKLIFISPSINDVLGYDNSQCTENDNFWRDLVHPDDRKILEEGFNQLKEKDSHTCYFRVKRVDGEYRWIRNHNRYVKDEEGNSLEIVGSWLEVDKQYKTEQQVKALAKTKSDLEQSIQHWEEKLKTIQDKLTEENRQRQELEQKLQQSEKLREKAEQELDIVSRQKNTGDQLKELESQAQELESKLKIKSDLLKEAELQRDETVQQLAEMEKTLQKQGNVSGEIQALESQQSIRSNDVQQSQDKWEFLSCMSHELRIAFNAILGFSQILSLDSKLDDQHKDYLNEISSAGNHILGLVNELIELTKLESGELILNPENICVVELLDECVELLKDIADSKGLKISCVNNEESISLFAYADKSRLKQVLLNVLLNTIKQTAETGTIEISLDKNDKDITLRVSHSSAEIPQNMQLGESQFGNEVEGVTTTSNTGIELLIIRTLLQLMNGSIRYDFDPNKTVSLQIPLKKEESSADRPIETSESGSSDEKQDTYTVLTVEPDATNLKLVESILAQRPDYRFLPCQIPGKCFEVASKNNPSVILIDITGFGVDANTLLKQLQEDETLVNIPVIALGTDSSPEQVERVKQKGFFDYLSKPLEINKLLGSIESSLQPAMDADEESLKIQSQ